MSLRYRERFSDVPKQAQAMTIELLETVCAISDDVSDPGNNSPRAKG
ncbi:hypothetical protein [Ciceribacter azotifigens]